MNLSGPGKFSTDAGRYLYSLLLPVVSQFADSLGPPPFINVQRQELSNIFLIEILSFRVIGHANIICLLVFNNNFS